MVAKALVGALLMLVSGLAPCCVVAYVVHVGSSRPQQQANNRRISTTAHHLVPLRRFRNEINFFDQPDDYRCAIRNDGTFQTKQRGDEVYELCLAEEADLPDLARFVVQTFGADAIRLSQDINAFERAFMQPAVELVNSYSGIVAFAEVLGGLRSRLGGRLSKRMDISPPKLNGLTRDEKVKIASGTSIALVLAKKQADSDWHVTVIGSVELRLEQRDAKIPFSLPLLDRFERGVASLFGIGGKDRSRTLQPYLSNLCVDKRYRAQGIGRALVRCVETIAHERWGYPRMFLHVDTDNKSAYDLYRSEGYKDVGIRWRPFWAGKAVNIGYYVKKLTGDMRRARDTAEKVDKVRNRRSSSS